MSLTLQSTQISVWPALLLMTGWNWPLTVNCTSRWASGSDGFGGIPGSALPACAVKRSRLLGMNWKSPRSLRIESGPAYQTVKYFSPGLDWLKFTGASSGR